MPTMRTPINRPMKMKLSPVAINAFRQKMLLTCRCIADIKIRCRSCQRGFELDMIISRELRLAPWQFPAIAHPDDASPYREASAGAQNWPLAQERFRMLAEACGIEA
jgi:hypothetical protein